MQINFSLLWVQRLLLDLVKVLVYFVTQNVAFIIKKKLYFAKIFCKTISARDKNTGAQN